MHGAAIGAGCTDTPPLPMPLSLMVRMLVASKTRTYADPIAPPVMVSEVPEMTALATAVLLLVAPRQDYWC